ncbi:MAG: cadmium-translocating P-type ATPase [Deltaproteobacteria bacterium]|nr:cadmium-translocating P-type ATPase [Deltaproteobacteria bacterium]
MESTAYKVYGMDCADEIAILKRELSPLKGVRDLSFDLLNGKMTVTYEGAEVSSDLLMLTVRRTGMRVEPYSEVPATEKDSSLASRWGRTILTSVSGSFLLLGMLSHAQIAGVSSALGEAGLVPDVVKLLYGISAITGAWFVIPKGYFALKRLRPDMNLLMVVAVAGAISIGEWAEAASVAFLFAVSLSLESWSISRARRAVAALMKLSPTRARVISESGNEELVDAEKVTVGARIVVKPGEKIPLDGKVVAGMSTVNQAPITGESMPVEKKVGDGVYAGTINEDGAIEVVTSKTASQSKISQIIKLVQEAQSRRAPSEQWVEKFAQYYTPAIMLLAVLVALVPPLLGGEWEKWIYEALVLLVIACPCALVLSTPVSIVAALAAAAKRGVLIKGGVFVELPSQLRVLALDKTGTLTKGRPAVEEIVPLSGHSEEELLTIATAIELRSEHPLAKSIVQYSQGRGIKAAPVENYQAIKGKGASATLNGQAVWIGSHRYLEERGDETPEMHATLETLSAGGRSVVVIGEEGHVCGFIALADEVREDSRIAIKELKKAGIERIVMLTGDNLPTANAIAAATGVDEVRAELLPEDKVKAIEELVAKYQNVGMVGDGVNDAPALARSTMGIAMGVMGSDAALETADVALMQDDLRALPWLIEHSRRTLKVIRQNIFASIGVKVVFLGLTFLGTASLWAAIVADMGVSLAVVANALRLLKPAGTKV